MSKLFSFPLRWHALLYLAVMVFVVESAWCALITPAKHLTQAGKKGEQPLAVAGVVDSCVKMRTWIGVDPQFDKEIYKEQYDSLRHYIESCALLDNDWSYRAFPKISGDVQEYAPDDTTRYDQYRDWLISVLFLNPTNSRYFCGCVEALAFTYPGFGHYNIPGASLAVFKYLVESSECYSPGFDSVYRQGLRSRHETWLSGDRSKPEDTTLPSLEDIGLGILLDHNAVSPSTIFSQVYLSSFTSSPNPFKDETHLRYHLNRTTYVTIGIYDVLGHQVWGDGKGRSLEAGDHEVTIDGNSLPEGSLYARISTGFGEVKTVKLIKLLNRD